MSKRRILLIAFLAFLVIAVVATAVLVHLFVFPRTTVFQETGIRPEEITQINILRQGYTDNISVEDSELIGTVTEILNDMSLTKAYRYEHQELDAPPSYTYIFRTRDGHAFAIQFYNTGKKIDLIKYKTGSQEAVGWEYTLESFDRQELEFLQNLVPETKWITKGTTPLIQFAPDKFLSADSVLK